MSSNTHATGRILKTAPRPPGSLVGPMSLPLSYNRRDYKMSPSGSVLKKRKRSGHGGLFIDSDKKGKGGANRYRRNKLLDAEPIE